MILRGLVFSTCSILPLLGCATARPPRLDVIAVRPESESGGHTRMLIEVQASNPGPDPLPLKDVVYSLALDGAEVFSGQRDSQATVARYSTQRFVLPAVVSGVAIQPGSTRYRVRGTLTYVAPEVLAQTLFDNKITSWTSELKGEGTVESGVAIESGG